MIFLSLISDNFEADSYNCVTVDAYKNCKSMMVFIISTSWWALNNIIYYHEYFEVLSHIDTFKGICKTSVI